MVWAGNASHWGKKGWKIWKIRVWMKRKLQKRLTKRPCGWLNASSLTTTWHFCCLIFIWRMMIGHVLLPWKTFLAILTLVWFLFGVSPDVIGQSWFPSETFLAMFTLIWFLFGVSPDVIGQSWFPSETFLTILTLVWFLFGVSPDVIGQSWFPCETFLAVFTLIWFLFGVSPDVIGQVTLPWKTFLTVFTLVWFLSSLVWVLMWLVRVDICAKHFWQCSHWYGFSLVWVLMWSFMLDCRKKHFWQYSHWYGFSLMWVLIWLVRIDICAKHFWHCWHWYLHGFFFVWVMKSRFEWSVSGKHLWQLTVLYFNLCLLTCCFIRLKLWKYMPHMEQVYGFNCNIMCQWQGFQLFGIAWREKHQVQSAGTHECGPGPPIGPPMGSRGKALQGSKAEPPCVGKFVFGEVECITSGP